MTGKGTRREREAVEILKRSGYATYRPATVQYGENDPFGLFDVLAVAPHHPPRFVQVKSNGARGRRSWFRHASMFRRVLGVETEMWVCHDQEGWRVIRGDCDGSQTVFDGRESNRNMGESLVEWLQSQEYEND